MTVAVEMEWRNLSGFNGYKISEHGDIVRIREDGKLGARLRGSLDADGYIVYCIRDQSGERRHIACHRLVAISFIGPPPSEDHQVAHLNGSRIANHHSNLAWKLSVANHADRFLHGTASQGVLNGRAKITEEDVRLIRAAYRAKLNGPSRRAEVIALAESYGMSEAQIYSIANYRSWSHVK